MGCLSLLTVHCRDTETSWTFDNKRQSFTITTLQSLIRGDAVYDSYGPKCNSRFFVNYGFALEFNEENQCVIPLAIQLTDPLYTIKVRYLGGYASSTRRRFQIPVQYAEKETKEAFSFARFAFADEKCVSSPYTSMTYCTGSLINCAGALSDVRLYGMSMGTSVCTVVVVIGSFGNQGIARIGSRGRLQTGRDRTDFHQK